MLVLFYLYIYIYITNIPPIMIINRICENQNLLSLEPVSFLVGLRTSQHPCRTVFKSTYFRLHSDYIVKNFWAGQNIPTRKATN